MISRRLIRIKTLQALYAWQQSSEAQARRPKMDLQDAILRTYDVYVFLLELPHYLNEYLLSERGIEKKKFYPDKEKIRRLGLFENCALAHVVFDRTIPWKRKLFQTSWTSAAIHFDQLAEELLAQDFARDYLIFDKPEFGQQQEFLDNVYHWFLNGSEFFDQLMEELYASWHDDEETLQREINKTLAGCTPEGFVPLASPMGYQHEDVQFALKLFDRVVEEGNSYEDMISSVTENWDPGRIAVLDLLCIKMALAEFLEFPLIPVKVSINEYLEIVKDYSTPSSGRFLNGVLDKLRIRMEAEGKLSKSGRGLRDK